MIVLHGRLLNLYTMWYYLPLKKLFWLQVFLSIYVNEALPGDVVPTITQSTHFLVD